MVVYFREWNKIDKCSRPTKRNNSGFFFFLQGYFNYFTQRFYTKMLLHNMPLTMPLKHTPSVD